MKVEVIVRIYNDEGVPLYVGCNVIVKTNTDEYLGTIKRILPKSFSLVLDNGKGVQINYNDVVSIE